MSSRQDLGRLQREAFQLFQNAGLVITDAEGERIEIVDLGLSQFLQTGLGILVYVNTDRCCAKELAMWPGQTCPQHRHPNIGTEPGKEETFRCRWGKVFLYVSGQATQSPKATPPKGREQTYTVWHEIELNPGDQYTIVPDTWHWFQAGTDGAVISEFSTRSTDEYDLFTDPEIRRATKIA